MKKTTSMTFILGALLLLQTIAANAGNSPRGDCALKNTNQRNDDYKACNEKHGTKPTPERSACFKDADKRWKETETECRKLSDIPVEGPAKKK